MNKEATSVEDTVSELLEQERQAKAKYQGLFTRLHGTVERRLLERIICNKSFEIESLNLLKSGKVPDRFIGFGIVSEGEVNFRESPSPYATVISILDRETPVILTERRGNWVGIRLYDGRDGWVFRDYVHLLE